MKHVKIVAPAAVRDDRPDGTFNLPIPVVAEASVSVIPADPEFRRALTERVRVDPQFLPNIPRGGTALFDLLSSLVEK